MRTDLYGLAFETPGVTFYLWSPWRASALEHKLFEVLRNLSGITQERGPDEWRLKIDNPKLWQEAIQATERVLKGWQEEGNDVGGGDRRAWRWMLEADIDSGGYDQNGEPSCVWLFLKVSLERGSLGEAERGEDIDLDWFGVCVHGNQK